uniref:Protein REVERSION-TO-ETHYLENE SENSITIVITY1 n=1 Tax=Noccaea caerulescens TaxID=107243 RepID=A0A1J3DFM0_NOCCA
MSRGRVPMVDLKRAYDIEEAGSTASIIQVDDDDDDDVHHDLWPLGEIDPKKSKFPCCIVWTPLPVVSWLAPFIGHVGLCREDGVILDFSGSNFITVDDFAFGPPARYLQLDRTKCCLPPNMGGHTCKYGFKHTEFGSAVTWDDALRASARSCEHRTYNLFTCNCHSFVADCMNRLCYGGSMEWKMVNVAFLILVKGKWVSLSSVVRSFLPCAVVTCLGVLLVGWPFLIGLFSFSLLLVAWFIIATYCFNNIMC